MNNSKAKKENEIDQKLNSTQEKLKVDLKDEKNS